jgi:tetratricopeptide (TPR) repeat protein
MKKIAFILLGLAVSAIFTGSALADESIDNIMKEADATFATYHLDIGNIQKSITMYESVVKQDKKNITAMLKLAKAWSVYGDVVPQSTSEQDKAYETGKKWAARALGINQKSAQAHFWYFVNLGKILKHRDMFTAMGNFSDLKSHIFTAYDLDPNDFMIVDALGVFYRDIPDIMGRDMTKSESYIRKAIAINPNYARAQRELAQTLYDLKRYKEAKEVAENVLIMASPSDVAAWTLLDKPKAQDLLKEINANIK